MPSVTRLAPDANTPKPIT
ncbi:hypothetical protein YPPY90_1882, partial [Yersinia pestis PY-90]